MNDTDFAPEKGAFFGFTEMCWHGGRLTGRIVAMALLALSATAMFSADDARAQSVTIVQTGEDAVLLPDGSDSSTFNVVIEDYEFGSGAGQLGGSAGEFLGILLNIGGAGIDRGIPANINASPLNPTAAMCTPGDQSGCVRSFSSTDFTISIDPTTSAAFFVSNLDNPEYLFRLMLPKVLFDANEGTQNAAGAETITIKVTAAGTVPVDRRNNPIEFALRTVAAHQEINAAMLASRTVPDSGVGVTRPGTANFNILADGNLSALTVSGETIDLTSNPVERNYTHTILDTGVNSALITATPASSDATTTVTINDAMSDDSGTALALAPDDDSDPNNGPCAPTGGVATTCTIQNIDVGDTAVVNIIVSGVNNDLMIMYTVTISHRPNNDTSTLSDLEVTDEDITPPIFSATTSNYSVRLSAGDDAAQVVASLSTHAETGNNRAAVLFCVADTALTSTDELGTRTAEITNISATGVTLVDIYVTAETVVAAGMAATCGDGNARARDEATVSKYTITFSVTPVPAMVTVARGAAEIREDGGTVNITVSLDAPAVALDGSVPGTGPITLSYEFSTAAGVGDATFGTDYAISGGCVAPCAITGTIVFDGDTGEQRKEITVTATPSPEDVLVPLNGEDEGPEDFTFTILATGNPFDTVDIFTTITITEMATEAAVVKNEIETVTTLIGAEQVGSISGLIRARFTSPASVVASAPSTPDTATALHLPGNPQGLGDILNGLGLEHTADADGGGVYAVWARGTYTSMEGDPMVNGMKVDYDGDSTGLGVGVEKVTGRYIAGVAMNWLTTDLDLKSEDNEGLSKYEESLLMVAPYLALRRDNGRSFWISAGYGTGDADGTTAEDAITASADVSVTFLNTGADFVLTTHQNGELIGSLSALAVRKTVDSFNFAGTDPITATTLNTFRGQGEVTYYRSVEIGDGRIVKPYVGLATLHDAGDKLNDDSHALDLRGGGEFRGEKINASLEVSTELLRKDHKSWTISGSARYLFSPEGLGASLTLDGSHAADSDMGLEGGYGMPMRQVHRDALLTPFAGMRHGSGSGEFSSGMRLAIGSDMDADLRAARRFSDDEDTLKLNFRRTF